MSAMQICSYGWTVFVVVWLMAWFKTKRELIRTGTYAWVRHRKKASCEKHSETNIRNTVVIRAR
jgi:hypothetical protein